jgi:phosphoribosylanthranilate isomerase
MTRTRVKVCGLTRSSDAGLAIQLGADALGVVLWDGSPRAIDAAAAAALFRGLPPGVVRVGVFVNASPAAVAAAVGAIGLDAVQLHGDEDPLDFLAVGAAVIKATPLETDDATARALAWPGEVTVLVDASDPVRRGGTGTRADWDRARRLAKSRPVILAGGLTPGNVGEAIAAVRPWGLDVSSGVEDAPGVKDAERLARFFDAVGSANVEAT